MPAAYLRFDPVAAFPSSDTAQPVLVSDPSESGDGCHRNLHNVSDNRLDKLRKDPRYEAQMVLCTPDGGCEPFTRDRAVELHAEHFPAFLTPGVTPGLPRTQAPATIKLES